MTNEKLNNSKARVEQVASIKPQTLKLGLDVHAESIVVVRMVDQSAPQPAQKFTPAKFREWVKGQLRLAQAVHSCYEAGPFGYGLHRYLVKLGIHNLVVQPVCLDERHTGVNHDKSDAKELALRLDRYVAGNPHALATVRVPTPAEEQKRIASRQREQLKREVLRVAAQGRSLLLTQGYRDKARLVGRPPVGRPPGQVAGVAGPTPGSLPAPAGRADGRTGRSHRRAGGRRPDPAAQGSGRIDL